jgi:hypothetical protein
MIQECYPLNHNIFPYSLIKDEIIQYEIPLCTKIYQEWHTDKLKLQSSKVLMTIIANNEMSSINHPCMCSMCHAD